MTLRPLCPCVFMSDCYPRTCVIQGLVQVKCGYGVSTESEMFKRVCDPRNQARPLVLMYAHLIEKEFSVLLGPFIDSQWFSFQAFITRNC